MLDMSVKGEWNPGINLLSVDEAKYDDQTVKIWAKLDNPFKNYESSKFQISHVMGIIQLEMLNRSMTILRTTLHSLCTWFFIIMEFDEIHQLFNIILPTKIEELSNTYNTDEKKENFVHFSEKRRKR